MAEPYAPDVTELSSRRVFPALRRNASSPCIERVMQLSLIDATVVGFSNSGALWILSPSEITTEHLTEALTTTLDAYPQWCGRIRMLPFTPQKGHGHYHRYGRLQCIFGGKGDPGVHVSIARSSACSVDLLSKCLIPSSGILSQDMIDFHQLFSSCELQEPRNHTVSDDKPAVAIRLTTLSDGSIVLGVEVHHCFADAHGLVHFMQYWAATSCAMVEGSTSSGEGPNFDPELLTNQAYEAGDIDAAMPDPALIKTAHDLPFERNDWWAKDLFTANPPQELSDDPLATVPAGNVMPWEEWDTSKPVSTFRIHFSKSQTDRMFELASTPRNAETQGAEGISRHDTVVAHVWQCINRARGLESSSQTVHLNQSVGLRSRLGLGHSFMGSPIVMADAQLPGSIAASGTLLEAATAVRRPLAILTATKLKLHLYGLAFERSPKRMWQAFLGRRNTICTSWCRLGLYSLDFGVGSKVEWVGPLMPAFDGILMILEGRPKVEEKESKSSTFALEGSAWYEHGVDVMLSLQAEAMDKLIKDPYLFP